MSKRPNVRTSDKTGQTKIALYERIRQMLAIERVCTRFHLVARQLGSRHEGRSTLEIIDEIDLQDLLRALLTLEFDDIRSLDWVPSYSDGTPRRDFLLVLEQIVIISRLSQGRFGANDLANQLDEYVQHYAIDPGVKTLVLFLYDPDRTIPNPRTIENDLSTDREGLNVRVIIAPKRI